MVGRAGPCRPARPRRFRVRANHEPLPGGRRRPRGPDAVFPDGDRRVAGGALGAVGPGLEGVARAVPLVRGTAPALARHRGRRPPGRARRAAQARGRSQGFRRARGQAGRGRRTPPASLPRARGCAAATRPRADDPCGSRGVRGGHRRTRGAHHRRPLLPRCRRRTCRADLGGLAQAEPCRAGPGVARADGAWPGRVGARLVAADDRGAAGGTPQGGIAGAWRGRRVRPNRREWPSAMSYHDFRPWLGRAAVGR